MQELVAEIKQAAAQLATAAADDHHAPLPNPFTTITGSPQIDMPLERPLWSPRTHIRFDSITIDAAVAHIQPEQLETLYSQFFIDEGQIHEQIEALLEEQPQVTLVDVIQRYPLRKGLAELLAYYAIATRTQPTAIQHSQAVMILLESKQHRRTIRVPQIIFSKE